jgi:cbb3-type cytochrome oxidase subunit 3
LFLYHWYAGAVPPFTGVAVNVTLVPVHIGLAMLAAMVTDGADKALTVYFSLLLVAVAVVAHTELLVNTHQTLSLFFSRLSVYVLAVPTTILFLYHWYAGAVPPFTGVAVNVTLVPLHIGLVIFAAMVTDGVDKALTVYFSLLLLADVVVIHVALLVNTHQTLSLFFSRLSVYVLAVPTTTLFLYHWYAGADPPFTAVAVNITLVPVHIGLAMFAAIVTDGAINAFTMYLSLLLVADVVVIHVALLVNTHQTLSLFFSRLSV